ncbi:MAG: aminoacyl-tRNA hydrolase [Bacteroidota bacterium]
MKYLIAGLGNIGSEYVDTRHNIGFMVLDRLAEMLKASPELNRLAYTVTAKYRGRRLVLVMPTTYMNLSGKAVKYYMDQEKIPLERIMIVTDDLNLPFGTMRMRAKGSHGGHNGFKHIDQVLGTNNYARIRMGIGNEYLKGQQVDYVLSPFTDEEFEELPDLIDKACQGILSFASIGIGRTMNDFNKKKKKPKTPQEPKQPDN